MNINNKKIPVSTIDTGVPVPGKVAYPLKNLAIGESFLFATDKRASVSALASRLSREAGTEYTIRRMDENNCRVWRTK